MAVYGLRHCSPLQTLKRGRMIHVTIFPAIGYIAGRALLLLHF